MSDSSLRPPDPSPGRRPASSWLILTLSVLITLVTIIGLLIGWLRSAGTDPDTGPPTAPIAPSSGPGIVQVSFATDPVNTDTIGPVAVVLTELQTFWSGPFVEELGSPRPDDLGPVTAVDPGAAAFAAGAPGCVSTPGQVAGNAYFCPQDHGMLFDNAALIPILLDHYGEAGLIASLAHEYGHFVQSAVGPTSQDRLSDPDRYPALLIELQADCYAGVFLQHVMSGGNQVQLSVDDLPAALAPLVEFHDPADLDPADPTAHGSALDRMRATLLGVGSGPAACRDLDLVAFRPVLGSGGAPATTTPRWSDPDEVRAAAADSVTGFAAANGLRPPETPIETVTSPYGQFGAATLTVLESLRTDTAALAACRTGAWVSATTAEPVTGGLGSWSSDADEAALTLLDRPGTTATDLRDFVRGYQGGPAGCGEL